MTHRLDFIDVSHYQADAGTINWSKVAQSVPAVIIKATQGTGYKDPKYQSNRTGAEAAGMRVATYHFLEHGDIDQQVSWYLNNVIPAKGERVVVDYEKDECTADDLVQFVEKLLTFDVEVTVYGAAKLTEDVTAYSGDVSALERTSLWAARYSSEEPDIATQIWPVYTAWQYSQSGTIPGISGNVDCNMFNGSKANMLKWFGPARPRPPMPQTAEVRIETDGNVRVIVNGQVVTYE